MSLLISGKDCTLWTRIRSSSLRKSILESTSSMSRMLDPMSGSRPSTPRPASKASPIFSRLMYFQNMRARIFASTIQKSSSKVSQIPISNLTLPRGQGQTGEQVDRGSDPPREDRGISGGGKHRFQKDGPKEL